jgi:hypothetical protein
MILVKTGPQQIGDFIATLPLVRQGQIGGQRQCLTTLNLYGQTLKFKPGQT